MGFDGLRSYHCCSYSEKVTFHHFQALTNPDTALLLNEGRGVVCFVVDLLIPGGVSCLSVGSQSSVTSVDSHEQRRRTIHETSIGEGTQDQLAAIDAEVSYFCFNVAVELRMISFRASCYIHSC